MTVVIEATETGCAFRVRVSPRASRDAIGGAHDGALKVSLTAPPVDGAANAALVKLLAKRLRVAKSAVRITSGETGRSKRVEVDGVTPDQARGFF